MRHLVTTILVAAALCAVTGCAATAASSGAHSYEPHTMNVLVGGSFNREGNGVAVGANYEYRKEDNLGFGAFGDVAFASDGTSTALGGLVFWHPAREWSVFGGPGVMFAEGDTTVIARVGGAYSFQWKKYTLSPTGWVDLGDEVALFLGMGLILHF